MAHDGQSNAGHEHTPPPPPSAPVPVRPASAVRPRPASTINPPPTATTAPAGGGQARRIRLVPHLENSRSLHFDAITRDVRPGDVPLRIGRFTDRNAGAAVTHSNNKLAFRSKVVSRGHAEIWLEGDKFFIRDTKSSSGTFLNHIRLAPPNAESRPFALKDGDILQLGVDYQGGTEEIYRCVKMRVEVGREWQNAANAFNQNALAQLRALANAPSAPAAKPAMKLGAGTELAKSASAPASGAISQPTSTGDCCICLFAVTVCQALFIAPCSHAFHYKCIRPLLTMHHPGFNCPLCRTFADLNADVE
ncbi:SMAD/FHA domain-containing protein, partial [Exidia glandulosa HHB12029]